MDSDPTLTRAMLTRAMLVGESTSYGEWSPLEARRGPAVVLEHRDPGPR
ncbi:MAG: hypothetical protein L0H93_03160 [Nocardioides sp.]|nr:hypothetical protein [Nocardioides sp.]